jgi:hypothetical protein
MRQLLVFAWAGYAAALSSYTMSLLPFSIEVRSTQDTDYVASLKQEMLSLTEAHLHEFFSKQIDLFNHFQTVELESASGLLVSEVSSGTFSSTLSFSGELTLEIEEDNNISLLESQIGDFQRAAFDGQAKIDFLNYLQSIASDTLLSSATYAKMTFIHASQKQNNKSTANAILIACSIGFLVVSILIAAWSYYSIKIKNKKVSTKSTKAKSNLRNIPDLELAKTESMSPSNDGPYPTFFDADASINTFLKNGGKSVITTNTIDVNGNVDMMAWKHSKTTDSVPFETDLTMISAISPNRTMEVPKDLEIGTNTRPLSTRESKANYLSKTSLSYHNEARFESHARRYHEKKSRTSRVTYR